MSLPHFMFLLSISFIWGSMFIVAKIGLMEFPPILFTALRFAMLAVILIPFIRVPARLVWPLVRVGIVMGIGMYLTLYYAIYLANNTAAISVVSQLEVPIAVILGVLFLGEAINVRRVTAIAIAFAGVLAIGFDPAMFDDLPAVFWMTASATLYAVSMIMVRGMEKVHALTITAWLSMVSAPVLFAVSLAFESGHWEAISNAGWPGWGTLAYTVVFGSIISHSGMYYLLQRYPVSLLAPFMLLSPVISVAGGVMILDDVLTTRIVIGIILVLGGVAWLNRQKATIPANP